ncbi:MAG: phosphatase PAP2-related protein [Planctomycetota bacterium]
MKRTRWLRVAVVVVGLALWFLTQSLLGARELPPDQEVAGALLSAGDGLFALTAGCHQLLHESEPLANGLLIVSSLGIDILALFLIIGAIFGPTLRPFVGLILLFALRQLCQTLSPLPQPAGMIWHDPGFPSLLVTYSVANDFFFSGHTALATLGAIEVGRMGGVRWSIVAAFVALFEMFAVIVLRAHYTMDVYAGAVTALLVAVVAARVAPACDRILSGGDGLGVD